MAADRTTSRFELYVPTATAPVFVNSFTGREQISKSYRFSIVVEGPLLDVDTIDSSYVGKAAHFCFARGIESERWVHGIIHRMRACGLPNDRAGDRGYEIRLVPTFRLLGHKKDSRIFQDKTVPEIVAAVLGAWGVRSNARLSRDYTRRLYVVQHQETDLHFVERLLAEEGMFYFFEHAPEREATELMVLADAASAFKPIAGNSKLRVHEYDGMASADDRDVVRFRLEKRVKPGSLALRDYDFARPSFDLRGDARAAGDAVVPATDKAIPTAARPATFEPDAIEQYHHHSELETDGVDDGAATRRLEQHRRKRWVALGETKNAQLVPGRTITLDELQIAKHPGSYAIFAIEHTGHDPIAFRETAKSEKPYANRFEAIPASAPFRPRPPPPRTQQVLESAMVVGPKGEEIHTDEMGRIKVQFHWDRQGRLDDHSSCWIRVMQPWGGAGWGFQFIPRVGMEVMVAFLAGDTDRPVVLGSVYNAEHPPSFALPEHKTKSGIRTQSTPKTEGYNEISFEDRAGDETIFVRAEKYLTEKVNVDHTTHIGHDRTLVVDANHKTTVGADMSLGVTKNLDVSVMGDRSDAVTGRASVNVGGNLHETVHGNRASNVSGAMHAVFGGAASARVTGHAALSALGSLSVNVGSSDGAPGNVYGHGPLFVGSDEEVVVNAAKSILIACGSSTIRLTPDKIEIAAKAIVVKGDDTTTVRGSDSIVELGAEARIASAATRLFGRSSSCEVSTNAYMKGVNVLLGAQEGDAPKATDDVPKLDTQPLSMKVSDASFNAMKSRPFELTVDGVRYKGTTGGDGTFTQSIPKSATQAHLLVWEGDPPTGKRHEWNLAIGEAPAASTPDGARARLAALGYPVGTGDELDATTQGAIRDFQADHGVDTTGELDGATAAKLTEVHGH